MRSTPHHLDRFAAMMCVLAVATASIAGSVASPASKLDRIGDVAVAKCQKTADTAASAIAKAAAKGKNEKAMASAERARAQLESIAAKAHASLDKTLASLEKKLANAANAQQVMLALDFTMLQTSNSIELHLDWCLAEIDEALADAGLLDP